LKLPGRRGKRRSGFHGSDGFKKSVELHGRWGRGEKFLEHGWTSKVLWSTSQGTQQEQSRIGLREKVCEEGSLKPTEKIEKRTARRWEKVFRTENLRRVGWVMGSWDRHLSP